MAEAKKTYPYSSVLLYNLACDVAEMYKAKVTEDKAGRFAFTTEMYRQKKKYIFDISEQPGGCLLSIATPGDGEQNEQDISFMFGLVDNMLAQFPEDIKISPG